METVQILCVGAVSFALTFILTYYIRKVALRRGIMDVPNARSSHQQATPRGGGMSFVIVTLLLVALAGLAGWMPTQLAFAVFTSGALVAGIGFLDDLYTQRASTRLVVHFLAACVLIAILGPIRTIPVFAYDLPLGLVAYPFTVLVAIWLINLCNFMDGINGIASAQSITLCLGAVCVGVLGGTVSLILLSTILGAAVFGFMLWNFPKGRIFMGDAGSGFLGIMALALILMPNWEPQTGAALLIMLCLFVTDATLTLISRLSGGEKIFEPHRSHVYQRLSRHFGGHTPVTLGFIALQLCVMLPLALWAYGSPTPGTPLWLAYLTAIPVWIVTRRWAHRHEQAK